MEKLKGDPTPGCTGGDELKEDEDDPPPEERRRFKGAFVRRCFLGAASTQDDPPKSISKRGMMNSLKSTVPAMVSVSKKKKRKEVALACRESPERNDIARKFGIYRLRGVVLPFRGKAR